MTIYITYRIHTHHPFGLTGGILSYILSNKTDIFLLLRMRFFSRKLQNPSFRSTKTGVLTGWAIQNRLLPANVQLHRNEFVTSPPSAHPRMLPRHRHSQFFRSLYTIYHFSFRSGERSLNISRIMLKLPWESWLICTIPLICRRSTLKCRNHCPRFYRMRG